MVPTGPADDALYPRGEGGTASRARAPLLFRTGGEGDALDAARGMVLGCALGGLCWLLLGALLYGLVF
jgi:hypothetical protein